MILADSSFLIAFFDEADSQHEKAVKDMKKIEESSLDILVSEHVLGETATVLLYHAGLDSAKAFVEYAQENFIIDPADGEYRLATTTIFINQQWQLSYIDASVVFLAKFLRSDVICYDEKILKEINRK
ncbi:PIN domain-containing protein [Candidatus Micrarchaeota archaeon]|nr:PIN domain-containing protein [Candidatus Micrarchaeota archaeon]